MPVFFRLIRCSLLERECLLLTQSGRQDFVCLRGPTHGLKAALNLEGGSEALEVVAGPHAARPPWRRYPLPATVVAADPPRSSADEEDSAVAVHESAVAVERPATPRARATAAPAPHPAYPPSATPPP